MDKKGHLMPSYSLGRIIERAISRCPPKQIFPERPGDYRGMLLGAPWRTALAAMTSMVSQWHSHGDVPPRRSERDRQRGLPTWQLI
jgi:proteasome lid subunit RPN8/RPN11